MFPPVPWAATPRPHPSHIRNSRIRSQEQPAVAPAPDAADDLASLLEAARAGDAMALGRLYDRYSPGIYRYLYRSSGDVEVARDLTSAVFIRVLEAIHSQHTWRESFSGWLYRIAHNMLVDYIRAKTRRPESELRPDYPCPRGAAMEEAVVQACLLDDVRAAVGKLRPEYAAVLVLRFGEGLTHAEVGQRLGKSEDTVKVTQFRALKALKRQLDRRPAYQAA
jgi:RNA polymerase sigma-70 factor (ECF subfamily)